MFRVWYCVPGIPAGAWLSSSTYLNWFRIPTACPDPPPAQKQSLYHALRQCHGVSSEVGTVTRDSCLLSSEALASLMNRDYHLCMSCDLLQE